MNDDAVPTPPPPVGAPPPPFAGTPPSPGSGTPTGLPGGSGAGRSPAAVAIICGLVVVGLAIGGYSKWRSRQAYVEVEAPAERPVTELVAADPEVLEA